MENEQIIKAEKEAVLKYEKGAKDYRPIYRQQVTQVKCCKCKSVSNLILATKKKELSFKTYGHKKDRNDIPILDNNGNKIYFCNTCLKNRIDELKKARK